MSVVQCASCGYVGTPKVKGSFIITIILLCIGLLPGIIYEIWRRSGGKVCSGCGSHNIGIFTIIPQPHQANISQKTPINSTANPKKTTLVADDLFSYNQSVVSEGNTNQLSSEELAKQELRRRNQAFIASKSKKNNFNFIKLLLIVFALAFGVIFALAMKSDEPPTKAVVESEVPKEKINNHQNLNTSVTSVKSNSLESNSTPSSFNDCKNKAMSAQLAVAGTQYKTNVIVDSPNTYVARICTNDGSVLITCSGYDEKMILTKSPHC